MFEASEDQELKFTIKDSNIQGQGTFPVKDIKKGEFIGYAYQIMGEIGKLNEETEYIIGQETLLGNMHNHSYTPTAEPKDIPVGITSTSTLVVIYP